METGHRGGPLAWLLPVGMLSPVVQVAPYATRYMHEYGVPRSLPGQRRHRGLLGTPGDGWDVGWAAAFLASDEARLITGATLPVDAMVAGYGM